MNVSRRNRDFRKVIRDLPDWYYTLPVSMRALGYEMIRIANPDGTIRVGDEPAENIARLIVAHRSEYRHIRRELARFIEIGFCSLEGVTIRIHAFEWDPSRPCKVAS